jgi:putative GTP pyrophosphokinase
MGRQKRCFLSSTLSDLRIERQAVREAIERAGFLPVMMEFFTTDSRTPAQLVTDLVDTSAVLLLVLGASFGSKDQDSNKYFVELEYERAMSAGIPVHVFLSDKDRLIPEGQNSISQKEREELRRFRSKLQKAHAIRSWFSSEQLKHEVFVALSTRRKSKRRSPPGQGAINTIISKPNANIVGGSTSSTPPIPEGSDFSPLSPTQNYIGIVAWYENNLFAFDETRELLERHVRSILLKLVTKDSPSDYTVYSRTKKPGSLQANLERPKHRGKIAEIEDVHDLIGLRVVVLHEIEVEEVTLELLAQIPNSTLEVKEPSDPLSFGYRSHHILSLYDGEIAGKSGFRYEIQIRTFLQHTWAQIEHKLGYKSTVYDDSSRRLFAQVSAILEIADGKFSELKQKQKFGVTPAYNNEINVTSQETESALELTSLAPLTEQAVFDYFVGELWNSSKLQSFLFEKMFAFSININEESNSLGWQEPLYLLGKSNIKSIGDLHEYFETKGARISAILAAINLQIEFSAVTPLLLLWTSALTAKADGMIHMPAVEVRALLESYSLFPEDDRDSIADIIATKPYLH